MRYYPFIEASPFVNHNPTKDVTDIRHYKIKVSHEDVDRALIKAADGATYEEMWLYNPSQGILYEIGEDETDKSTSRVITKEMIESTSEVNVYHLHPHGDSVSKMEDALDKHLSGGSVIYRWKSPSNFFRAFVTSFDEQIKELKSQGKLTEDNKDVQELRGLFQGFHFLARTPSGEDFRDNSKVQGKIGNVKLNSFVFSGGNIKTVTNYEPHPGSDFEKAVVKYDNIRNKFFDDIANGKINGSLDNIVNDFISKSQSDTNNQISIKITYYNE